MGSAEALGGLVQDRGQYAVEVVKDIAIPKAQYRPPRFYEESRPAIIISLRVMMLGAIEFHRQLRGPTGQVQYIGTDDQLPSEARSIAG